LDNNQSFRIEVIAVVLHFFITIFVLGGYLYTVYIHQPDETLKNLLLLIGGYWFGVLGKNAVAQKLGKKTDSKPDGDSNG